MEPRLVSLAFVTVMEDLETLTRAQLMSLICKATVILAKRATR